jgi:SAM-dependent methyltransferase
MPSRNNTNRFYDAIAAYYPLFYRNWATQMEREGLGLRTIFRNRGITRVLDASCGAGAQAVPMAQLGFEVVAADPSTGMLRQAVEIAKDYRVRDKIHFVRCDFLDLPQMLKGKPQFDAIVTKGNALPHLTEDVEIVQTLRNFYKLLRPGGTLVIGMRDFAPFMEDRPEFIPGLVHKLQDDSDFITFDVWEWRDGPPVLARQNLFIVTGQASDYKVIKRRVVFRPLSTDEVKVVLVETGFTDITDQPDRTERVLVARKPER